MVVVDALGNVLSDVEHISYLFPDEVENGSNKNFDNKQLVKITF
jgi:hypothetical protein